MHYSLFGHYSNFHVDEPRFFVSRKGAKTQKEGASLFSTRYGFRNNKTNYIVKQFYDAIANLAERVAAEVTASKVFGQFLWRIFIGVKQRNYLLDFSLHIFLLSSINLRLS